MTKQLQTQGVQGTIRAENNGRRGKQMEKSLIMTKFGMPVPRENYVVRERLFFRMEKIRSSKVALIEGGAGTGKTTLISSWFQRSEASPVFWITLDETFDHVIVFWQYVIEALKDITGDDSRIKAVLRGQMQEETMDQVLVLLINRQNESEECFLVLDDVQHIRDKKLLRSMDFFISHMPDNIHMVMSGRQRPGIYLGGLAMDNQLFEIQPEELKINDEEAAAFLKDTLRLPCGNREFSEMCSMAGGWIGGLQLLSLSFTNCGEGTRQRIFNENIADEYMEKEVLSGLTQTETEFLTVVGILGYFDEEICEAMFQEIPFQSMIRGLFHKNLMLIVLDEEKEIYCCHDILKEFFCRKFEELQRREKEEILWKASEIYLKKGDFGECLKYAVKRKDYGYAMKVIAQMEFAGEAISYLKQIPIDLAADCPEFACQAFFYYYSNFEEDKCARIFSLIEEKLKYDPVYEAFSYIDLFLAKDIQQRQNEVLPLQETLRLPFGRTTMTITLIKNAYLLFVQDRIREAQAYLKKAEEYYRKSENIYIGFFLYITKCQMYEYTGELMKAAEAYEASRPLLSKLPNMKPSFYVGIAGVYIKQMELEKAQEALYMTESSLKEKSWSILLAWKVTKFRLLAVRGQSKEAKDMLSDIRSCRAAKPVNMAEELLIYFKVCAEDPVFEEFKANYESTGFKEKDDYSRTLYSLLLCEQQNKKAAFELLEEILAHAREVKNKIVLTQCSLIKAKLLLHKDDQESVRMREAALFEAVYYGAEEKIRLPFWIVKEDWERLLKKAGNRWREQLSRKEEEFIKSLPLLKEDDLLTLREKEVLLEIKKGKTNKEIARDLCISLATVKSHLIHIYSKLGASSRLDAVNKMEEYYSR